MCPTNKLSTLETTVESLVLKYGAAVVLVRIAVEIGKEFPTHPALREVYKTLLDAANQYDEITV